VTPTAKPPGPGRGVWPTPRLPSIDCLSRLRPGWGASGGRV